MHPQQKKTLEKSSSIPDEVLQNGASNHLKGTLAPTIGNGKLTHSASALGATYKEGWGSRLGLRSRRNSEQGQSCGGPPIAVGAPQAPQINLNDEQQQQDQQPAGDVPPHVDQQVDVQLEEPATHCCSSFYDCYTDAVMKFRNSAFIYLLQVLILSIPVSAIGMGIAYINDCRKASYLPILGIVIGVVDCSFMLIWVNISRSNRRGSTLSAKSKASFVFFCVLLTLASVVDAVLVYCLVPSSDHTSDYCNETFYTYSCYKGVAKVVFVVFSMFLYIPGMRHTVCCEQCQFDHSGRYYSF